MSRIVLGKAGKRSIGFDLKTLLKSRLLVQANSGGGKSWLLRLLAEALFGKVQVFLIDREGEFATLREKFGYVLVGHGGEAAADVRSARLLAEKLLELNASAVFDLYETFRSRPGDRREWVRGFLEGLIDAPKKLWHDVIVIVDEAHQFCPQELPKAGNMAERAIIAGCKDAMVSLATVGRKRGFCAVWATQRLAKLDKDASAELLNRLVGPTIEDVDVDRAADLMSVSRPEKLAFKRELRDLDPGNFLAFGRAVSKERVLVKIGPVVTSHPEPGSSKHAAGPPPAPAKIRHLLPKLKDLPQQVETKAKTEAQLRTEIKDLRLKLAAKEREKPKTVPAPAPPAPTTKIKEKIVEVPMLKKGEMKDLHKLVERMEKAKGDLGWASQRLEIAANGISGQLAIVGDRQEEIVKRRAQKVTAPPVPPPRSTRPVSVTVTKRQRGRPAPVSNPAGNGDETILVAGERKMLEVLALFRDGRTESQFGALAGYAPGGGTYGNYKRRLVKLGYMVPRPIGGFQITQEGLDYLGDDVPTEPPTPEELRTMWHAKLTAGERKMHQVLMDVYPEELTLEELGERSGYQAGGGTFGNYKRTLTRNAIAIEQDGRIKAADCFFEMVGA